MYKEVLLTGRCHCVSVGEEFEGKILANESGNAKFKFLVPGTPFHAYYKGRVAKIRKGDDEKEGDEKHVGLEGRDKETATAATASAASVPTSQQQQQRKFVPPSAPADNTDGSDKNPPSPELYTIHVPEGISTSDLELMKVSAQFAARNGKAFLTALASHKASEPSFAFLRPTHSLHRFFVSLTAAYARVMTPPASLLIGLKKDVLSKTPCLRRAMHRLAYERERDREEELRREREEKEREAMLSTDWQAFVVVETIEFEMGEESGLPRPMTLKDALRAARKLRLEAAREVEKGEKEMNAEDAALVAEADAARAADAKEAAAQRMTTAAVSVVVAEDDEEEETIRVVKNYTRPARKQEMYDPTQYVVSPLTGELVPINDMAEHMRVSLIDPRWKTQKEAMLAKMKGSARASDDEISRNLSSLAQRRPDVFGDRDALLKALGGDEAEAPDAKRRKT